MKQPWSLSFRYLIGVITFLALAGLLYYARTALEPLIIAAFIAYLINPAVMLLTRHTNLSRRAAVNLVYFSTLAMLIVTPVVLTPIFFKELQGVARDLLAGLDSARLLLAKPVEFAGMSLNLEQLGVGLGQIKPSLGQPMSEQAFFVLESTSRGAVWSVVIVVCVYLFMSEWQAMREWLVSLTPAPYRPEVQDLYLRVRWVWMGYLRGQILLMFVVGVIFTIAWAILGIPGALVLGVVAGLFTLVPDVGPFLAVVLTMAVALLEGSSWIPLDNFSVSMIVLAVYLVLISVKNFWLRPVIMGRSVNMNEGLVLVAILVATMLNGIIGALLAVPVLASAAIVVDYLLRRIANTDGQPADRHQRPLKKFNRN